jgi:hypothetical protein
VLEPVQQGPRAALFALCQEGGQELDRLAGAVLPHQRLGHALGPGGVVRSQRQQRASSLLRRRPVADGETEVELGPARGRALRRDAHRALDEGGRGVVAAGGAFAGCGSQQRGLQELTCLRRVAGVEILGCSEVLGPDPPRGPETRHQAVGGLLVRREGGVLYRRCAERNGWGQR